jgi:hypothetical protein
MRGRLFPAAVVMFLILGPARHRPAWGWGIEGHQLVGLIAEHYLSPAAREQVRLLLGTSDSEADSISDPKVANWADEIRGEVPETGPWHFVDIPLEAGEYVPDRDCPFHDCVIERIEQLRGVLAQKPTDQNLKLRRRALKFLVHFVADLHQPLHCAERKGADGVPDRGGNDCPVVFPDTGKECSLHAAWDNELVERSRGGPTVDLYAKALREKISVQDQAAWEKGSVRDWAMDTHLAARDAAYQGLPASRERQPLDEAYLQRAQRTVDGQLSKAGVRLAKVLNEALKGA